MADNENPFAKYATSDNPFAKYAQSERSSGPMDFVKSIPRGLVEGPLNALHLGAAFSRDPDAADVIPSTETIEEHVTGPLHKPEGTAGKFGEAIGSSVSNPLSYIGPGSIPAKVLTAVTGGAGSEAGGQLAEGTRYEPTARAVGGVVGGAGPGVASRAITPLPINAQRAAAVNTLRNEGVNDLTAGQITGNRSLRYAESMLGDAPGAGAAATRANEASGRQFTDAGLRRSGAARGAGETTPEAIDRSFDRIGTQFDVLAARNSAPVSQNYLNEIAAAQNQYNYLFQDPMRRPIVEHIVDQATNHAAAHGIMGGAQYNAVRSSLGRIMRSYRYRDPDVADFARETQDAMDRLMQAHMAPGDAAAWQQARNQYRNLLVLEKASTGGGENAAAGEISPARLRGAVVGQNRRDYARGNGDFADLARAGEQIMTPLPNSGSAQRALVTTIPAAIGTTVGALTHGAPEAMGAAAAGASAPGLAGRVLMSRLAQAYLGNQAAPNLPQTLRPPGTAARTGAASVADTLRRLYEGR
jgi:hypothetical protein